MLHMSPRNVESSMPDEMSAPCLQKPPRAKQDEHAITTDVICHKIRVCAKRKDAFSFYRHGEGGINGTHDSTKPSNDSGARKTTTRGVKVFGDSILLYWILVR